MAELFQGTQIPEWMSPGKFMLDSEKAAEGIGRTFSSAFQAASHQAEQKRQFDMMAPAKLQEAELMNKAREVQVASGMISNQQKDMALDDALTFKTAQTEWSSGNTDVQPSFKTVQGASAWTAWRNQTDAGAIQLADRTQFLKGLSSITPEGRAAVTELPAAQDGGPSHQQWMELNKWTEIENKRKFDEQKQLKAIAPTIAADSRENVAQINADLKKQLEESRQDLKIRNRMNDMEYRAFQASLSAINNDKILTLDEKNQGIAKLKRLAEEGAYSTKGDSKTKADAASNSKTLDKETASKILDEVGGDAQKARDLARQRGYEF